MDNIPLDFRYCILVMSSPRVEYLPALRQPCVCCVDAANTSKSAFRVQSVDCRKHNTHVSTTNEKQTRDGTSAASEYKRFQWISFLGGAIIANQLQFAF